MQESVAGENAVLLSVVIPLFNKARTIVRAVNSVLAQTYTNLELIVVDDGSTDEGAQQIATIDDPRVTLVRQGNAGVSVARNVGAAAAKGEFVCFLDADDEWYPQFLERIAQLIDADPEAGLYCCRYEIVTPQGQRALGALNLESDHWGKVSAFYRVYARSRSLINSSCVCVRKEALLEIGGFPEGEKVGEDVYVWLSIAQKYRVMFDARVSVCIYQNAENRTVDRLPPQIPYFLSKFLSEKDARLDPDLRIFLSSYCLIYTAAAVLRGHRQKATEYRRLLWRTNPGYAVLCQAIGYCPTMAIGLVERLRRKRRELNAVRTGFSA